MTNNFRLKAISIIAAIILWVYVVASVNPTVEREYRNIPITYKNLDTIYNQDLSIVGERETSVNVVLEGNTNDFINVSNSDIRAEVDLTNYDENSSSIDISFYVPDELQIVSTSISEVPIRIERVISKQIKVELEQEGTPNDNLAVVVGSIIPETIVVEGASSLVDQASRAVAVQDMTEITSNTTRNLPVMVLDSNDEEVVGLNLSQNFVNVSYNTYKIVDVPIEFVIEGEYDDDITVHSAELSQEEVSILIPAASKQNIASIKTEPFDISEIRESGTFPVELEVPEGVELRDENIEISVTFDVSTNSEKTFEIASKSIEVKNSEHEVNNINTTNNRMIQVSLSGADQAISELTSADIQLYVDAEGLAEGVHSLKIEMEDIENIVLDRVSPERIEVQLGDRDVNETSETDI